MQRGVALKALRQESEAIRRRTSEGGAEQPLLDDQDGEGSRARWRRANNVISASTAFRRGANQADAWDDRRDSPGDSFYKTTLSILGSVPGAGLRGPASAHGDDDAEPSGPPPAFWSPRSDAKALWGLLMSSWLNLFLVLVPLGIIAYKLQWNAIAVFTLNFCGIIPLALILGDVTEDLALRSGEVIGGLVNATFGNVVELILSCVALTKNKKALNNVAGLSNLGSILSNLLLVLGCCFLFGGMFHYVQSFNAIANQVCNSLLFLAVVGLTLPLAAVALPGVNFTEHDMLWFSRIIAVLLLATYVTYLYFQLQSHSDLFKADKGQEIKSPNQGRLNEFNPARDVESSGADNQGGNGNNGGEGGGDDEEEEKEQPVLTVTAELLTLLAISVIVAMASEFITDSIQDMAKSSGLTTSFLSIVLLPLAGNAVEHITAVMVAMKNKMDLALGIALGSSIQIAIFVLPTCVLFSWSIGNPFTLQLDGLGTVALAVAITHANFITAGGRSHYLMGVQLICTYLLISSAFLFTHSD